MTTEPMTDFELRLSRALQAYADAAHLATRPARTRWASRLPIVGAAAALLLAVGLGSVYLLSSSASRPAEARVNGQTYAISIARSLEIGDEDVTPFGTVESTDMYLFADSTAYVIDGVDPEEALVVRADPDAGDDGGRYGDWILLIRGDFAHLCPYFDPTAEATPAVCRADAP